MKGYACDRPPMSSIGHKRRRSKPVANTAKKAEKTTDITANCSKPSACWASRGQSWAQHIVAKDEDKKHEEDDDKEGEEDSVGEGGKGGFKLDEAKTRATKSLDKDKGQDRQYN